MMSVTVGRGRARIKRRVLRRGFCRNLLHFRITNY
jgi:hypothetical protein